MTPNERSLLGIRATAMPRAMRVKRCKGAYSPFDKNGCSGSKVNFRIRFSVRVHVGPPTSHFFNLAA